MQPTDRKKTRFVQDPPYAHKRSEGLRRRGSRYVVKGGLTMERFVFEATVIIDASSMEVAIETLSFNLARILDEEDVMSVFELVEPGPALGDEPADFDVGGEA